jgi:hypothetical protein
MTFVFAQAKQAISIHNNMRQNLLSIIRLMPKAIKTTQKNRTHQKHEFKRR